MNSTPLISIGVPTFNRPKDLDKCVELLLNQTYQNLEIIVVDNCSDKPESINLLNNWPHADPRVKIVINNKNYGVLKNAQIALEYASGDLFCWVSDDDWRSDKFIEELYHSLLRKGKGYFASSFYRETVSELRMNRLSIKFDLLMRLLSSNSNLLNQLLYFLIDHSLGKCNLFYSLFWKSDLEELSLQRASRNWKDLSMDRNLIFSALGNLKLVVVPKVLMTLKTGNEKHYKSIFRKSTFLQKAKSNLIAIKFEFEYSAENIVKTTLSSKLLLFAIIPIKIASIIVTKMLFLCRKLFFRIKDLDNFFGRNRESKAIAEIETSVLNADIKLKLSEVTLVAVATVEVEKAVMALLYSSKNIQFSQILLLSSYKPWNLPDKIIYKMIDSFKSVDEWCEFVFKDLHSYIKTPYIILIHPDGYIVDYKQWKSEFLNFDYIGAPWPLPKDSYSYRTDAGKLIRVGNSVSLRSMRLLTAPSKLGLKWEKFHGNFNEDGIICVKYHELLVENGLKFPPPNVAYRFSIETALQEFPQEKSFAFHRWKGVNSNHPRFSNY